MIHIAITGHRPDSFLVSHYEIDRVKKIVDDTLFRLKKEYKEEICLNLGGALGVDMWAGMSCLEQNIMFKLYLPFHPKIQAMYWNDEQKKCLDKQLRNASGIDIIDPNPSVNYSVKNYFERNRKMVDDANIVVAFWVGKKRGGTYDAMKYGLQQSKFVFNALDNLRPIFTEDLKTGWTPPTVGE